MKRRTAAIIGLVALAFWLLAAGIFTGYELGSHHRAPVRDCPQAVRLHAPDLTTGQVTALCSDLTSR